MSTYVSVVISPATTTSPVVTRVSQATRPSGSSASTASRTVSDTWSATLSGCPSVTDSDVKRNSRAGMCARRLLDVAGRGLLDRQEACRLHDVAVARAVEDEILERREVCLELGRQVSGHGTREA